MNRCILVLVFSILIFPISAQVPYEVSSDPQHPEVKVLKGVINKDILRNDTAFSWYAPSQDHYMPDSLVFHTFKKFAANFQFVIFGGTWCDDTQYILPKFFKLQELSGLPDKNISLFGVDRSKKALGNIADAFDILNVPTIIIMKEGKEIGRIVEYGKTGKWNTELANILTAN